MASSLLLGATILIAVLISIVFLHRTPALGVQGPFDVALLRGRTLSHFATESRGFGVRFYDAIAIDNDLVDFRDHEAVIRLQLAHNASGEIAFDTHNQLSQADAEASLPIPLREARGSARHYGVQMGWPLLMLEASGTASINSIIDGSAGVWGIDTPSPSVRFRPPREMRFAMEMPDGTPGECWAASSMLDGVAPLRVKPLPAALCLMFYTGLAYALLVAGSLLRKIVRRHRTRCVSCCYDISSLPSHICPECGTPKPTSLPRLLAQCLC